MQAWGPPVALTFWSLQIAVLLGLCMLAVVRCQQHDYAGRGSGNGKPWRPGLGIGRLCRGVPSLAGGVHKHVVLCCALWRGARS